MKKTACVFILFAILAAALHAQAIVVTQPAGGEAWAKGSTHTIAWTINGNVGEQVQIVLRKGDSDILVISEQPAASGSLSWTIPDSVALGQYCIRVRKLDGKVSDDSATFGILLALPPSIPPPPPALTIITPNGGANQKLPLDSDYVISWKAVMVTGKVRLELVRHNGQTLGIIADNLDAAAGFQAWKAGKYGNNLTAPPGEYHVRICWLTNTQVADQSDEPFTLKFISISLQPAIPFPKPDLVACIETAIYVPLLTPGTFHVNVRNIGQGVAKAPFDIEICKEGYNPSRYTVKNDLAAGKTVQYMTLSQSKEYEINIRFTVTADPDDTVKESNEGNNTASGLLIVGEGNPQSSTPIRCSDGTTL